MWWHFDFGETQIIAFAVISSSFNAKEILSPFISKQNAYGYVSPSENFFASEADQLNLPSLPFIVLPRPALTFCKSHLDVCTCVVRVFHQAVLGALILSLPVTKGLSSETIEFSCSCKTCTSVREVIALCLGLISNDDNLVSRLPCPLSLWYTSATDLVAYTPQAMVRLAHSDRVDKSFLDMVNLKSPLLRIELVPRLENVPFDEQVRMVSIRFLIKIEISSGTFGML